MKGLLINETWMEDLTTIKSEVHNYFKKQFEEPVNNRPRFESPNFKKLTEAQNAFLQAPFTEKEIKDAVLQCSSSKALGSPEG